MDTEVGMTSDLKPWRITISLVGTKPLFRTDNLRAVLNTLEASPFAPNKWQKTDRGKAQAYSAQAVLDYVARWEGRPMSEAYEIFRRTKSPKQATTVELSDRPRVAVEADASLAKALWPAFFELGDALANVTEPDWGGVHLWYETRDDDEVDDPWPNEDVRDNELMFRSALLAPKDYYKQGPRGLVMRTYIGPHFVEQFSQERIETLPLEVEKLAWGGYRVDLAREPWLLDMAEQLVSWRQGMAHLSDARIFARPDIKEQFLRGWSKGECSVVGGIVRGE